LWSFEANPNPLCKRALEQLFGEILSYLHENHFKEVGIGAMNLKPVRAGLEGQTDAKVQLFEEAKNDVWDDCYT
jgi:hypothetical protein